MNFRVNEIFYSLQGEGYHTGTPAVFVRFAGCNLQCPFCDTDFTNFTTMSEQDIILNIKQYPAKMVVLTGGEPTLQITANLCRLIQQQGYYITIETNGTRSTIPNNHNDNTPVRLNEAVNWITCSPKAHSTTRLNKADELKIVLTDDTLPMLDEYRNNIKATHHFLQPCSNSNTGQVINYIKQHPTWRLSLQTHKLIGIQ